MYLHISHRKPSNPGSQEQTNPVKLLKHDPCIQGLELQSEDKIKIIGKLLTQVYY